MKPYSASPRDYILAVLTVAVCTAVSFLILPHFNNINLVMIYLLGTLVISARGYHGPAALTSALGVLAFDFFFIPPRFRFSVHDAEYIFTFIVMFIVAMIISRLTIRLRLEAELAREGERRAALMHAFSQALNRGDDALLQIAQTFNSEVRVFTSPADWSGLSEKDQGVAHWVMDQAQPAGLGETSLPGGEALFLPLRGPEKIMGVMRIRPRSGQPYAPEERRLLDSFANQLALALDAAQTRTQVEAERTRSALLSSVSHDFRTPLTAIVGSASALAARAEIKTNPPAFELAETIQHEGERLSRQIQNLLEVTRFESGALRLKKELYPIDDIIGTALGRFDHELAARPITTRIAPDLPPVPVDGLLLEQVFLNLLENALRHTPPGAAITIAVEKINETMHVAVSDQGPGLKADELERVFEKFYHAKSSPGAGLGLAICRAIITAHGGKIWAENDSRGGAAFHFTLPLNQP